MAIRQRKWVWKGKEKSAWVVDYFDAKGKRRLKTFKTKREADDWRSETRVELKQGTHVADRDSITVEEAGKLWIATCEQNGLEHGTLHLYRQYLRTHINPLIGAKRLNEVTVPAVRAFHDQLRADGRSAYLANKVITYLGGLLADAQSAGSPFATRSMSVSGAANPQSAMRSVWRSVLTFPRRQRSGSFSGLLRATAGRSSSQLP